MKGKDKDFVFLDPAVAKARRNRVQFFLDDNEYATLEAAAELQGTKAGELAGAIFRKHVLPALGDEVHRLQRLSTPDSNITEKSNACTSTSDTLSVQSPPVQSQHSHRRDRFPDLDPDKAVNL